MNKKTIWQAGAAGVVVIALVLGISALMQRDQAPENPISQNPQTESVSLSIEGLYSQKEVVISSNQTLLELLISLDEQDPAMKLQTKTYAGLGTLVESMGGKTNGEGDAYWQYEVNGVMPQVGADAFILSAGDSVEWVFRESEF